MLDNDFRVKCKSVGADDKDRGYMAEWLGIGLGMDKVAGSNPCSQQPPPHPAFLSQGGGLSVLSFG